MLARALVASLLVTLSVGVFFQVRDHEFIAYDDGHYIIENPLVTSGFSLNAVGRALRTTHRGMWYPLTWISHQIDFSLYRWDPAGYLLTNVALHTASVLLLVYVLTTMTGSLWPSAFVAAVFAVHPLHVESVAWASERKDVLSGFFWMSTLVAYRAYAACPGWASYAAVLVCFTLGLLAKPMGVTLPFVLLLLDYWPLRRLGEPGGGPIIVSSRLRRALLEKAPLLALSVAISAVAITTQGSSGAMELDNQLPFVLKAINAVDSYVVYIAKTLWPSRLGLFYPHPLDRLSLFDGMAALTVLMAVSAWVLRGLRKRPYLAVGWFWYLITLLPVIGFVQVGEQARADRYMYLPLVGLSVMIAWAAADLAGNSPRRRAGLAAAGALSVAALTCGAWLQVGYWRDSSTLFERSAQVIEGNYLAHHLLARERMREGNLDEAEAHLRRSIDLATLRVEAHRDLGDLLAVRGNTQEALEVFQRAAELDPELPDPRTQLREARQRAARFGRP